MEVEITKDNFETLRNGDLPLVVDLWATWCGPCKAISPLVSKLAEEYDGKLVVGKCDVEQNEDITMEYAVRNIPTLLFFKDGKLVNKHADSWYAMPCAASQGELAANHRLLVQSLDTAFRATVRLRRH